ncbi:hypothetical protein MHM93_14590 [Pseudoalteromonas sp. MM17-2]|uniref:hypothetical protein n=1 Tax=Pseudoalteromonas sp. MM17-2 TaxID=2917753 RepID=UPI001EF4ED52|nr:hypothetical protein [Pseudoalteromonas sp. MM17-2]MCG7545406.1 hypothetical protein [Pseudoalteromonas sp. MM17-2]
MANIKRMHFANGCYAIDIGQVPFKLKVEAIKRAEHGDWKTQLVHEEFMGMEEGQSGDVIKVFENFEGIWCRVKHHRRTSDISPSDLIVLE